MQPVYQVNAEDTTTEEPVGFDEQTSENAEYREDSSSISSREVLKTPTSDSTAATSDSRAALDSDDEAMDLVAARGSNAAAIYLNGVSGDDHNNGQTADTAVKTFSRAKELASDLDFHTNETVTIYVTGTVSISGEITLNGIDAIVKREKGFNGYLMKVESNSSATLSSITIDGNSEEANSAEGAGTSFGLIDSSGTLNIADQTVLRNNIITAEGYFQSVGGAIRGNGGTINMTGGEICNNTSNMGGGVYLYGGGNKHVWWSDPQ